MINIPRILLTSGEPAGVGPDLIVRIAQQSWSAELVVIADPNMLQERAALLGLPLELIAFKPDNLPSATKKSQLCIIPVPLRTPVKPGMLDAANADYVLETLLIAGQMCLDQKADALVTAPVHKAIINSAGHHFLGHTEFFAQLAGVPRTVMLFVVDDLKVALATTHLPLNKVSENITQMMLRETITILHDALRDKFNIAKPRISIAGLNPHAGESGYLGREEIDTITPVIERLQASGMQLTGPLPADTIFTAKHLKNTDAVLAMYHDQALPLVKYLGFEKAVNVTLGLPFIRTSVDHGTALDIAGTDKVDIGSMEAALQLAIKSSCK